MGEKKGNGKMTAIPLNTFKTGISEYIRKAADGQEIIAENKHNPNPVSLVDTGILSAALGALRFKVTDVFDEKQKVYTVALDGFPPYGEGKTREEAVESLVDTVIDYCGVYVERAEVYRKLDTALDRAFMLKLIRCGEDREAIRRELGL